MSINLDLEYPKGFESSVGYIKISNEKLNIWVQECIDKLESDSTIPFWSISSGDSLVMVHRYNSNGSKYKVIVTNGYAEKVI